MTAVERAKTIFARRQPEILLALGAFAVYCVASGSMLLRQSQAPHFVYQADAWLHGRLDVGDPPNYNDWVHYGGKWFVSFPPFPAVLMLPFVAINGLAFNDVFFTVCIAAINVGLLFGVLRAWRDAEKGDRTNRELALLTIFFAFGTVYFYSSIRGEVWFTAHVVGVTLTLIYIRASLGTRHPIVAGLALGCAAVTRANLAFAFPFFLIELNAVTGKSEVPLQQRLRMALPKLVQFGLAGAVVLAAALWMNHARWGSWTEFGHGMLFNNRVNRRIQEYGLFNLRYLQDNFPAAFLMLPEIRTDPLHISYSLHGMSMFVTTPLLMLVPFALKRTRTMLALGTAAFVAAVPGLVYMNDGWQQFGFRFSIDYLPYLFLILALGRAAIQGFPVVLGIAGIVVNAWGASTFGR
jgi:hypothetical protein